MNIPKICFGGAGGCVFTRLVDLQGQPLPPLQCNEVHIVFGGWGGRYLTYFTKCPVTVQKRLFFFIFVLFGSCETLVFIVNVLFSLTSSEGSEQV